MNFIELLFIFLVFYLLYKLVFNFIVPVYRASSQIRSKMNEVNQQYNQRQGPPENPGTSATPKKRPPSEDYIDFEEIK